MKKSGSRDRSDKINRLHSRFPRKMQTKLVILFALVLLAFVVLCVRLIWITREKGVSYEKQVLSQQRYDSSALPYKRGDIVDAKGTKLATCEKVYNLIIDASVMSYKYGDKQYYLEPTLKALGQCFPQLDMGEIRQYVTTHDKSSWYVALRRLPYDEISEFQTAMAEDNMIRGVWFQPEYKRIYPNGSLASDVIGFTSTDNIGMYGLEEYYNDVLNGINGREYGYLNDDSDLQRTIIPATDGYTLHSTIDANIQGIVEKYLRNFNDTYKNNYHEGNGAENVGCVIMDVNSGEVLAMASYPFFDLNNPKNTASLIGSMKVEQTTNANGYLVNNITDTAINETVLATMTDEEILLNLNSLWKNYCISNTYEPGSTAKPFTVAAALETGAITGNEVYTCKGSLEIGGETIHCHNRYGDGEVSVKNAVAWSCNVALMKIASSLGRDEFVEFQKNFNFGLKTNVDLAGEARTVGLVYNLDTMKPVDLAVNSFGQGFNATMIQMITAFSSLINGGYYYEPHLVDKITNSGGATVENIEPRLLKRTISTSTSLKIREYCKAVVFGQGGTGKTARPAGYAIGGKTGTAQTIPRGNNEYVVSFMGYAPADDPQIAIYVVVDRPNAKKQDDAKYATRIVRSILTEVLPYMNIYMTEELSDAEKAELEALNLEITSAYSQKVSKEQEEAEQIIEDEFIGHQPAWKSFDIDPATGYRVDPNTGDYLDPDSGDPIYSGYKAVGEGIAASPEG